MQHYQEERYQEGHGDKQLLFRKRAEELWVETSGGRLLDIGCSTRKFLQVAKERGFDVYGIEPSEYGAKVAREKGLDVVCGLPSDLNGSQYDVVTSNHVLEHVIEPIEFMMDVRRVLRPGGIACIEVPNEFDNLPYILNSIVGTAKARGIFYPHINSFDIRSLRNLFARAGLRLSRWYTYTLLATPDAFLPRRRLLPNNAVRFLSDSLKKGRSTVCFLRNS